MNLEVNTSEQGCEGSVMAEIGFIKELWLQHEECPIYMFESIISSFTQALGFHGAKDKTIRVVTLITY
jgi:hypothetical protein